MVTFRHAGSVVRQMTPTQPTTDFVDSSEVCSFIKMKGYFKGSIKCCHDQGKETGVSCSLSRYRIHSFSYSLICCLTVYFRTTQGCFDVDSEQKVITQSLTKLNNELMSDHKSFVDCGRNNGLVSFLYQVMLFD